MTANTNISGRHGIQHKQAWESSNRHLDATYSWRDPRGKSSHNFAAVKWQIAISNATKNCCNKQNPGQFMNGMACTLKISKDVPADRISDQMNDVHFEHAHWLISVEVMKATKVHVVYVKLKEYSHKTDNGKMRQRSSQCQS